MFIQQIIRLFASFRYHTRRGAGGIYSTQFAAAILNDETNGRTDDR
jgi:hypothetical protein